MAHETIFKENIKYDIKKPKLYKVILLNDDYTTMDFVVYVIITIFHKTASEATRIMLDVHEKGKGIVGVYTYDIANTKIHQVKELAVKSEFPLEAVMEEE
jgi:ATP-dependent Clp protease adaptor protein ClpS